MRTLSISIAALAVISTSAFADGNHSFDGNGAEMSKARPMVQIRSIRTSKVTATEGLISFQDVKVAWQGGRDHAGGR